MHKPFGSHFKCEEKDMSVIFQKAYSYLLIQDGNDWYLTYFTGGPVDIDICVKLTEEEISMGCAKL
jgi:hypothetical protein